MRQQRQLYVQRHNYSQIHGRAPHHDLPLVAGAQVRLEFVELLAVGLLLDGQDARDLDAAFVFVVFCVGGWCGVVVAWW